jgi:type II secretory pathway pseudopilin PulG
MNADGERAGAGGKSDAHDKRGSTQGSPLGSLSNGGGSSAPRRVCDFFVKYGNCRSGRACKFLHVAPNLPNQQAQQQAQQQVQLLQLLKEQQEMQVLLAHQQSSQSSLGSQKTLTPSNSSNSLCYAAGLGLDGAGDPSWRDMETAMQDWRDHLQGRDSESEDGGRGWDADRWTHADQRINGMGYNPQVNRAMMVGGGMGDFGSNGGKFTQAAAELASIMAGKQHQLMQQQHQQILGRDGMNGGMRNMGMPIGAHGMMMGGNAKAALQQQAAQLQQMHNGLARGGVGIVSQSVGGGRGGGLTGAMGQPKVRWAVGEDGTSWFLKGDGWAHNSAGGNRRVCDGFDLMQGICRHGAQCNLLHLIGGPDDDVLRLVENRAGQESLAGVGSDSLGDGGEDLGMMGGMMMGNVQISMSQSSQPKMQQQMGMSTPMPRLNSASTSGSSPSQVMGGPGMSRQHSSSSLSTTGFDRWQSSTGPSDAGSGSDVDSAADIQSDIWRGDAGDSSKLGGIGLSSWSSSANGTGQGVPSDTIGFPGAKALWGGPRRSSEEEVGRLGDYLRSSTLCD